MEFVLSLTGATAGSLIAYVWPSMIHKFIKSGNEIEKGLFLNVIWMNNLKSVFKLNLKSRFFFLLELWYFAFVQLQLFSSLSQQKKTIGFYQMTEIF